MKHVGRKRIFERRSDIKEGKFYSHCYGVLGCSGISWIYANNLQAENHTNTLLLNFYRPGTLPDAQPTVVRAMKAIF